MLHHHFSWFNDHFWWFNDHFWCLNHHFWCLAKSPCQTPHVLLHKKDSALHLWASAVPWPTTWGEPAFGNKHGGVEATIRIKGSMFEERKSKGTCNQEIPKALEYWCIWIFGHAEGIYHASMAKTSSTCQRRMWQKRNKKYATFPTFLSMPSQVR